MSNLLSLINDTSHLVRLRSLGYHIQELCGVVNENLSLIIGFELVLLTIVMPDDWAALGASSSICINRKQNFLDAVCSSKLVNEFFSYDGCGEDLRRHLPAKMKERKGRNLVENKLDEENVLFMSAFPLNKLRCLSTHEFLKFSSIFFHQKKHKTRNKKSQRCLEKCEEIMTF